MDRPANDAAPRLIGIAHSRSPLIPAIWVARILLVLLVAAGVYFFSGFLAPVLAALVIGFATWPLYSHLVFALDGRRTIAATISLAVVVALVLVPIALLLTFATQEMRTWGALAIEANRTGMTAPGAIAALPLVGGWLAEQWNVTVGEPGFIGALTATLSGETLGDAYHMLLTAGIGAVGLVLKLVFLLITLFFVYKDGAEFSRQIDDLGERVFPVRWQRFSRIVPATVMATVTGMGMVALGEGVALGIAYKIAGVPSPATCAVVTAFLALVPGGAPLAFTTASLYLAATGSGAAAAGLFAWGAIELFLVDKAIRPKLVGGPVKLPFLPTFFGLIGGLETMGLLGIFVGPVLMALIVAIWREWMRELREGKAAAPAGSDAASVITVVPPAAE